MQFLSPLSNYRIRSINKGNYQNLLAVILNEAKRSEESLTTKLW